MFATPRAYIRHDSKCGMNTRGVLSQNTAQLDDLVCFEHRTCSAISQFSISALIYSWESKTIFLNSFHHWEQAQSSREMIRSFHYFPMSETFLGGSRQLFFPAPRIVIYDRNGLSSKNTITLKKSFPKSIKNSSHNRF